MKSTGSELEFIRVLKLGLDNFAFGRLRTSSEDVGRLRKFRTSLGIFGNDRVVFKNPSTPRIKISRLYLRESWQVYLRHVQFSSLFLKIQYTSCKVLSETSIFIGVRKRTVHCFIIHELFRCPIEYPVLRFSWRPWGKVLLTPVAF